MKKKLHFLIPMVLIFTTYISAQWTAASFNDDQFIDVHFTGTTGYAVGKKNIIYKSTDGGANWNRISGPFTNNDDLNSVFFRSPNLGWVGGSNNLVMRTTDGGTSWDTLNLHLPFSETVQDITFVNDTVGYVVGPANIIYKTTNGGDSLKKVIVTDGFNTFMFFNICFPSDLIGYAASTTGRVYKSTDAGETWNKITTITSTSGMPGTKGIGGMNFIDNNTGYIVTHSDGVIKTTDGGVTWTKQNLPGNKTTSDMSCGDATNCWITTLSDSLYFTTNGTTWSGYKCTDLNPGTASLEGIHMVDANSGFAVGGSLFQATILKKGTVSGIAQTTHENFVKWYPNPVSSEMHINFDMSLIGQQLVIYDDLGQLVMSSTIEGKELTLLTDKLKTGLYFLTITKNDTIHTSKFIKQN